MKNRWLINIALVIIVALLATIILYKPGKDNSIKEIPLTSLVTDEIKKIELSRARLADISLQKTKQGWRLVKPFSARANEFNVNALLQIAHTPVEPGFSTADYDLEKFGLKKPATVITLGDHKISIGRQHPLKNARYVLSGKTIFVLPMHAIRIAENTENDFINNRLLDEGMKLIEISLPALKLAEKNGQWKVISNKSKFRKTTADKINDFISEWENSRALTVMRYSGRQSIGKIRLQFKNSLDKIQGITLGILAYKPEFVLFRKDEGLEYHFPQEVGKRLLQPQQPAENAAKKGDA